MPRSKNSSKKRRNKNIIIEVDDPVDINENFDENLSDSEEIEQIVEDDDVILTENDTEIQYEYGDEKECIYDYTKDDDDDDDVQDVTFDDDDDDGADTYFDRTNIVAKKDRISKPILTKYERVRLLGERTQQLTLNAKPMIKNVENMDPEQIATLEIENNVIPLIIERPLPNGDKERWYIHELIH